MSFSDKRFCLEEAMNAPDGTIQSVLVAVVAAFPGVDLPREFLSTANGGIVSLRYGLPNSDAFKLDAVGIHADLRQNGLLFSTFVPWGALLLVHEDTTGAQVQWPVTEEQNLVAPEQPVTPKRRGLHVVREEAEA